MAKFEPKYTHLVSVGDLIKALEHLPPDTPIIPYRGYGNMPHRHSGWERFIYGGGNLFIYAENAPDYELLGERLLNYLNK